MQFPDKASTVARFVRWVVVSRSFRINPEIGDVPRCGTEFVGLTRSELPSVCLALASSPRLSPPGLREPKVSHISTTREKYADDFHRLKRERKTKSTPSTLSRFSTMSIDGCTRKQAPNDERTNVAFVVKYKQL